MYDQIGAKSQASASADHVYLASDTRPPSILDEFSYALTDLGERLDGLEGQLCHVLRPAHDNPQRGPDAAPREVTSTIREQLHQLHAHAARISSIVERLEV